MGKVKKLKISKKTKIIIAVALVVAIIAGLVIASQIQAAFEAKNQVIETITLEKADITNSVSVSGVIESDRVTNIYTDQVAYPVKTIIAKEGNSVLAGDLLAELDMSKLGYDVTQTEISLRSAQNSLSEEYRAINNSITNAKTSLESSQISLERQKLTTAEAEKELREAEGKLTEVFDSYSLDVIINDARIALDRKNADLETAQRDLSDAINNFDDYAYQNEINDAEASHDRAETDLSIAELEYNDAKNYYDGTDIEDDLRNHTPLMPEEEAIRSRYVLAEKSYNNAQRVRDDAEIRLDRAITNLETAQDDAIDKARDAFELAQNAYDDALRQYEKAMDDKMRAIEDFAEDNQTKLEDAQRSYEDSQKQLESSQNNVKTAENALNQANSKAAIGGTSVESQQVNLEKFNEQLAEGRIIATADGVVTEVNIKAGAVPSGVLFVIEDMKNMYVSAKVKEYNLADIFIGQEAVITSDAAPDKTYKGVISYISPKAVSEAGSTSVEFEVRARINMPDDALRIGMNAFLDIIVAKKSAVYTVTNSAIVTDERGSFVYELKDGEQKEIKVKLGVTTPANSEISADGLYDGMQIVLDPQGILNSGIELITPMMNRG